MNDPRKDEEERIHQQAPIINQMGIDAAQRIGLNDYAEAQLTYVFNELKWYLPEQRERGEMPDRTSNQMPHEWGSMDTYDDMRNSLRFAAALMDTALDPFMEIPENPVDLLKQLIIDSDCGVCALADEIVAAIAPNEDDDIFDIVYGKEED